MSLHRVRVSFYTTKTRSLAYIMLGLRSFRAQRLPRDAGVSTDCCWR